MSDQRKREGEREAGPDRDRGQLDVLDECRTERVVPVGAHPVRAERVVSPHAGAALPEAWDDRAGGDRAHSTAPASTRWKTRCSSARAPARSAAAERRRAYEAPDGGALGPRPRTARRTRRPGVREWHPA